MDWTYRKIAEWAPNGLILEKARGLSASRHWPELATDGRALWGACRSSGERTYRVAAGLSENIFRCDCNSPVTPCRHILALMLRYVKAGGALPTVAGAPAWAAELLRQAARPALSPETKAWQEAEKKRRFGQRMELMQQGIQDLEQWLADLVRQGLSIAESQPGAFWDSFAARMVDVKLGGIARRIRAFKAIMADEQWHSRLLGELGALYLFVQSFKQLEALPEPLQEELFALAGVNRKKEEMLQQKGAPDNWLVAGQAEGESEDEKLKYRRTWLLGEQSRRAAMLLDFAWGRQGYETDWAVGTVVRGEAVFYPGAYPLRALIRKPEFSAPGLVRPKGYRTLSALAGAYAEALAANPWLLVFPCLLDEVWPVRENGQWRARDAEFRSVPLAEAGDVCWKLLALSGGGPLQLFGEWDGERLLPLSAVSEGRIVPLGGSPAMLDGPEPGRI